MNGYILHDIISINNRLPNLKIIWVKVKSHLYLGPITVYEVLNVSMDKLASRVHYNNFWQDQKSAKIFDSTVIGLQNESLTIFTLWGNLV